MGIGVPELGVPDPEAKKSDTRNLEQRIRKRKHKDRDKWIPQTRVVDRLDNLESRLGFRSRGSTKNTASLLLSVALVRHAAMKRG